MCIGLSGASQIVNAKIITPGIGTEKLRQPAPIYHTLVVGEREPWKDVRYLRGELFESA